MFRGIRSFVLREGRLTRGQRRALETHWRTYGLEPTGLLDFTVVFGRRAPVALEIGFGNGENLLAMATAEPQTNFLGIEVHRPGIGHILQSVARAELSNLKIICADAVEVLQNNIADSTFERALILFPDPWPKRKHHKRRLLTAPFIEMLAHKMCSGGLLHLATDWREYADSINNVMGESHYFTVMSDSQCLDWCLQTRFEKRGHEAGREIVKMLYQRV